MLGLHTHSGLFKVTTVLGGVCTSNPFQIILLGIYLYENQGRGEGKNLLCTLFWLRGRAGPLTSTATWVLEGFCFTKDKQCWPNIACSAFSELQYFSIRSPLLEEFGQVLQKWLQNNDISTPTFALFSTVFLVADASSREYTWMSKFELQAHCVLASFPGAIA